MICHAEFHETKYHKTVEMTEDVRTDEPAAWMVFCPQSCAVCEYKVFANDGEARREADTHAESEGRDWEIYPLYASHPTLTCESTRTTPITDEP